MMSRSSTMPWSRNACALPISLPARSAGFVGKAHQIAHLVIREPNHSVPAPTSFGPDYPAWAHSEGGGGRR